LSQSAINISKGYWKELLPSKGTSAKADVPRGYLGRRVYVIITKSKGEVRDK